MLRLVLLLGLVFAAPAARAAEMTAHEIVDEANKLMRGQSSHSRITMRITTPKWERSLEVEAWNKGRATAIMRIHSPAKERGNGTLKVGQEIWNWLPAVERVIKIPPSMMHSSWMGSDFTYEDVVKADSVVKDYTHKFIEKETKPDGIYYTIQADPKPDAPVVWGKVVLRGKIDAQGVLPISEENYSERGELMRVLSLREVKVMDGRRIPTIVECVPQRKEGHKTQITYKEFEFDVDFPQGFFSLRKLQEPLR